MNMQTSIRRSGIGYRHRPGSAGRRVRVSEWQQRAVGRRAGFADRR